MNPRAPERRPWIWAAAASLFVCAVAASVARGAPPTASLPEIALSWSLLFHVERAAALLAVPAVVALIAWRAAEGELPTSVGQLKWESIAARSGATALNHEQRLNRLERILGIRRREPVVDVDDEA